MTNKKLYTINNWYLITIDDAPKFLPRNSFIDLFQLLSVSCGFNFIATDSIEGNGKDWVISNLQNQKNTVFKFEEFAQILGDINQLEWGDFFLFKDYPKKWNSEEEILHLEIIKKTDTTVRAVDSQYMYIYTPYLEIVEVIKNNYIIENIQIGPLETLDYPD